MNHQQSAPTKKKAVKKNKKRTKCADADDENLSALKDQRFLSLTPYQTAPKQKTGTEPLQSPPDKTEPEVADTILQQPPAHEDDGNMCAICHESMTHKPCEEIAKTDCNHAFCFDCISQWTSSCNSSCPLCKNPIHVLKRQLSDGTTDEQIIPQVMNLLRVDDSQIPARDMFACLDHSYFMSEISSLLQFASSLQINMRSIVSAFRSNIKSASPLKLANERRYEAVTEIKNTLYAMQAEFRMLKEFDPSVCLNQLYGLNDELKHLSNTQNSGASDWHFEAPVQYSEASFDDDDNYVDRDDTYDDEYYALHQEDDDHY